MKRRLQLILLSVITLVSTAMAQSPWWNAAKSNEEISISGELGLNLSQFTHVERWSGTKAGINIGIMAEKPILNSLSAKVGIFYTMKGTVGSNSFTSFLSLHTQFRHTLNRSHQS